MKNTGNADPYDRFYTSMNFERSGLFEAIKDKYGCSNVLYPGCSIHITPSFYFQHVVYVDVSQAAREYFSDSESIMSIVNGSRKYKQPAYIQFLNQDYTLPLPIRENNYDLLLAIYAPGITKACKRYVKPGGIIVSNNHLGDALDAMEDSSVIPEALIRKKGKKYVIEESSRDKFPEALRRSSASAKGMRITGTGMEYVDSESYFVFRKLC
jgi:hypothetical protein